jgi:Flp pilus assembly protein TadG
MEKLKNERGSVLVFVTLMIVLLMIMVGMGMDTGVLTFTRATGQGAVDAAALSAVSALPSKNATDVENRASAAFLTANNYTNSSGNPITKTNVSYVQYDFGTNQVTQYGVAIGVANGVRVALEGGSAMKTPAFLTPFLNLFGSSATASNNVSVSAVAVVNARPSIPIALWNAVCQGTSEVKNVQIAQQNPTSGLENSCWTTYLDKSSGGSDIEALFKASRTCDNIPQGAVDIGIPIYENKGQVASVYDTAYDFFMKDSATAGKWWLIPVITGSGNCNAKDPSPIVDWAKILVTEVNKHGSHSYIKANIVCNQTLESASESLCFSHRLVREHAKGM